MDPSLWSYLDGQGGHAKLVADLELELRDAFAAQPAANLPAAESRHVASTSPGEGSICPSAAEGDGASGKDCTDRSRPCASQAATVLLDEDEDDLLDSQVNWGPTMLFGECNASAQLSSTKGRISHIPGVSEPKIAATLAEVTQATTVPDTASSQLSIQCKVPDTVLEVTQVNSAPTDFASVVDLEGRCSDASYQELLGAPVFDLECKDTSAVSMVTPEAESACAGDECWIPDTVAEVTQTAGTAPAMTNGFADRRCWIADTLAEATHPTADLQGAAFSFANRDCWIADTDAEVTRFIGAMPAAATTFDDRGCCIADNGAGIRAAPVTVISSGDKDCVIAETVAEVPHTTGSVPIIVASSTHKDFRTADPPAEGIQAAGAVPATPNPSADKNCWLADAVEEVTQTIGAVSAAAAAPFPHVLAIDPPDTIPLSGVRSVNECTPCAGAATLDLTCSINEDVSCIDDALQAADEVLSRLQDSGGVRMRECAEIDGRAPHEESSRLPVPAGVEMHMDIDSSDDDASSIDSDTAVAARVEDTNQAASISTMTRELPPPPTLASSGWLHKGLVSGAQRPRKVARTTRHPVRLTTTGAHRITVPRVPVNSGPAEAHTAAAPAAAQSVAVDAPDAEPGPQEPSARKSRALALKQNSRFQQLRARIAAKSQTLPGVAGADGEVPAAAEEEDGARPIAAPLRGVEAVRAPPKYRHEVWFPKAPKAQ